MSVLYRLTGPAAGILSGLFGIGGGIIVVVSLATVGGLPFRTATGTSLAALLLPVSIGAAFQRAFAEFLVLMPIRIWCKTA